MCGEGGCLVWHAKVGVEFFKRTATLQLDAHLTLESVLLYSLAVPNAINGMFDMFHCCCFLFDEDPHICDAGQASVGTWSRSMSTVVQATKGSSGRECVLGATVSAMVTSTRKVLMATVAGGRHWVLRFVGWRVAVATAWNNLRFVPLYSAKGTYKNGRSLSKHNGDADI